MPDRSSSHLSVDQWRRRRRRRAAVVALLTLGLAVPGAQLALAFPGKPPTKVAQVVDSTEHVTLVTGDRVEVTTRRGRQQARVLPDESGRIPAALVQNRNGHVHVVPLAARGLLAAGRLDERLFDVTRLVADGHTDGKPLPVLVAAPAGPLGPTARTAPTAVRPGKVAAPPAPAGSRARRALPELGVTAVDVTSPDRFWTAIAGPAPKGTPRVAPARAVAAMPAAVGKVWLDGRVRATLDRSVPQIGGPAARAKGLDGTGVKVAVLDTGVDDQNSDVAGHVAEQADFAGEGDTDDHNGHGTHVASTVAGTGANSGGKYAGVAPKATLLDGKVLDGTGYGSDSSVLAGMEWAASRARVVSMSLGSGPSDGTDPVAQALDSLTARHGTLFVVAAGNDGPAAGTVSSPGTAASALTVGAVDRDDSTADFSSRGPRLGGSLVKPEITAPGVGIVAAQADGTELGPVVAPHYVELSGTSMATPHVAGSAALLAQQHPTWPAAMLKARLVATAKPTAGATVWDQGAGRVDLAPATSGPLRVDTGTLDLGFHDWPHGGDAAVTRELTYTNDGTSPLTVTLADTLADDAGTAAPTGAVTADVTSFTLAAGASRTVTLTARPDAVGVGRWGGAVTATTPAGTVRTALGLVKETEHYDLTLKPVMRDGTATADALVEILDARSADGVTVSFDASHPFRLPPGTYQVTTWILTDTDINLVTRGDVRLAKDTTLPMDARGSTPYVVAVPSATAEPKLGSMGYRFQTASSDFAFQTTFTGLSWEPGTTPLWAHRSAPVRTGTFDFATTMSFEPPALTARTAGGTALDAESVTRDERLEGTRTVDVVNVSTPVEGSYVLAPAADGAASVGDVVAPLAAEGAAGVVLPVEDLDRLEPLDRPAAVPVLSLPGDQWRALSDAAGSGSAALTLTGSLYPAEVWDLVQQSPGRVPASLTHRYRTRDLARLERTFRGHGHGGTGTAFTASTGPVGMPALGHEFRHGSRRTDWVTPGTYETAVWGFVGTDAFGFTSPRAAWHSDPVTYRAGRARETFAGQLTGAGTSAQGSMWRTVDAVFADVSLWTDANHRRSAEEVGVLGETVSWRLSTGGRTIAEGKDPFLDAELPPGRRGYVLEATGHRAAADGYALSTRVKARWTFPSATTGEAGAVVRQLSLDAPLPLDAANAAPRGRAMTFTVRGRVLGTAQRLSSLTVASSANGGRTWVPATVTRAGPDRFRVTVVNPATPGTVSLRLAATAPGGLSLREEVTGAYAVR